MWIVIRVLALGLSFVLLWVGLLWWAAYESCESSCDRWSYEPWVVATVVVGCHLLVLGLVIEFVVAGIRRRRRHRRRLTKAKP